MKLTQEIKDKVQAIAQEYLGAIPVDKHCKTWAELQQRMVDELEVALENKQEETEEYYIQSGYVGNAILWWRKDCNGYTANFNEAGRYSKEKALSIINNRPEEDYAWLCSHVDNNLDSHILTIENNNLDFNFRLKGKRK